ncbi:MAG: CHAT domain-containing protein, partial [Cyanobacteria bacterium J06628_4]
APLESELETFEVQHPISTLVFLLDGPLRNIPMSFLIDSQGTYLIEKYPVAVISSRQLFSQNNRQNRSKLLLAGITESRTFPEVGTLSALPAVENELSTITATLQQTEEPLLNELFTRGQLETKIDSNNYSIVHIATHGEFNSDPVRTFIMAWDQLIKFRDFADVLQVGQGDSNRSIDLLVLSACKTANGDRRAALGLAGAAAQANVRTTLATLWTVDDRATAEFMSQFYTHLQAGMTIAQAVQKTQLSFLDKSGGELDYRRPYYWAPFIIVGNWN